MRDGAEVDVEHGPTGRSTGDTAPEPGDGRRTEGDPGGGRQPESIGGSRRYLPRSSRSRAV